jgi:hypothetical protein
MHTQAFLIQSLSQLVCVIITLILSVLAVAVFFYTLQA